MHECKQLKYNKLSIEKARKDAIVMKKSKVWSRLLSIIAAMTLLVSAFALTALAEDTEPYLSSGKMTIKVGQLASVQVKNLPAGATVKFKSSNKKFTASFFH